RHIPLWHLDPGVEHLFPDCVLSLFLVVRHGFANSSGFLWLVLFTVTRIVGSSCGLPTINNPSRNLFIAFAICSSIGLLSRANQSTTQRIATPVLSNHVFQFFRIFTVVALALSIAAITAGMSIEGLQHPDIKIKVGMILYVVACALLALMLLVLVRHAGSIAESERRVLLAVGICTSLILVRTLYAVFMWFLHGSTFSLMEWKRDGAIGDVCLERIWSCHCLSWRWVDAASSGQEDSVGTHQGVYKQ
ncbi:hypothetical protein N7512_006872, partial [Penicillium capsulatum]